MDQIRGALFHWSLTAWGLLELGLRVRELARGRGRAAHDRGTRVFIGAMIGAALLLALNSPTWVPSLRMPGHRATHVTGLAVVWIGLVVRFWAVATLGRSFRTTVEVDAEQQVVSNGPYRWVRHPAYTGLLLILAGLGLGIGNWLALVACVVLPTIAVLRRIQVEEAELTRVLGENYLAYEQHTKRLIPGLW